MYVFPVRFEPDDLAVCAVHFSKCTAKDKRTPLVLDFIAFPALILREYL